MARKRVSRWMKQRGFVARRLPKVNGGRVFYRPQNLYQTQVPFIALQPDGGWVVFSDDGKSPTLTSAKAAYTYARVMGYM